MKLLYKDTALINDKEITTTAQSISDYVNHIRQVVETDGYDADEASINLPSDDGLLDVVMSVVKQKVTRKLKYIIDVGIGGSNLGTKAVYDALFGYTDLLNPDRYPKILFADTCNPSLLAGIVAFVQDHVADPEEVLINAISKSGGTTETIANTEIIMAALAKNFPSLSSRVVITSDEGSKLWKAAQEKGYTCLPIPKLVGGRYSDLSAVGLFPLAAAGIDIQALRKGAVQARSESVTKDISHNPALVSATLLYLHYKQGKNINDHFFFNAEMESVGKWYRQLMGESIGKEQDRQGKTVRVGITPTVSLGSTDLHSVAQLYLGGPLDKLTTFVWTAQNPTDATVPETMIFPSLVS